MTIRIAWITILLSACTPAEVCEGGTLESLDTVPRFAVVSTDYYSSAIALLDEDGALISEAWVDSGTVAPRIVAALSGDVALPTRGIAPCTLAVIDRFGTDVVTLFDPCRGALLGQVDVGSTFRANPQDVLLIDGSLWVSRAEPNLAASGALERGDDLLIIDRDSFRIRRALDLSALGEIGTPAIHARPGRMVLLASGTHRRIVVGLARASLDYRTSAEGAVAIIDPADDSVTRLDLPGFAACFEVDPIGDDAALVTCGGETFSSAEDRRARAGFAWLAIDSEGSVSVSRIWRAAEHPDAPPLNAFAIPIDADHIVATATGDRAPELADRVSLIGPGGVTTPVFEADAPFAIGDGAFDSTRGLLLVPDASAGTIRRFVPDTGDVMHEQSPVPSSPCRGLPPREVRPL